MKVLLRADTMVRGDREVTLDGWRTHNAQSESLRRSFMPIGKNSETSYDAVDGVWRDTELATQFNGESNV